MNNKAVSKNIEKRSLLSRIAGQTYLWLLLVVLYAPILLIIMSMTPQEEQLQTVGNGFSEYISALL